MFLFSSGRRHTRCALVTGIQTCGLPIFEKDRRREAVRAAAEEAAMERLLDALTGKGASEATRQSFRQRIREGHLDDSEVEIEVADTPSMNFELPGQPGQMRMINLSEIGRAHV